MLTHDDVANRRDYDVEHYIQLLVTSYAARLRKAFAPEDFEQLFRLDTQQLSLFDVDNPLQIFNLVGFAAKT